MPIPPRDSTGASERRSGTGFRKARYLDPNTYSVPSASLSTNVAVGGLRFALTASRPRPALGKPPKDCRISHGDDLHPASPGARVRRKIFHFCRSNSPEFPAARIPAAPDSIRVLALKMPHARKPRTRCSLCAWEMTVINFCCPPYFFSASALAYRPRAQVRSVETPPRGTVGSERIS